jgi:toxin YoeB
LKLVFTQRAWSDYLYWQETDAGVLARVNEVIRDASRSPFRGLGKPEPLQGNLKGYWSRRITREHRLVYRVSGAADSQALEIIACRYHYD